MGYRLYIAAGFLLVSVRALAATYSIPGELAFTKPVLSAGIFAIVLGGLLAGIGAQQAETAGDT